MGKDENPEIIDLYIIFIINLNRINLSGDSETISFNRLLNRV